MTGPEASSTYRAIFDRYAYTAIGPLSVDDIDTTHTAAAPTRTAIALTRNPLLAVSSTPNAIQVTASQIVARESAALTQTTFAGLPAATDSPCEPWLEDTLRETIGSQIETRLSEIGIEAYVEVIEIGVRQRDDCGAPFQPLATTFYISSVLDDIRYLRDDQVLADLTASILAVLAALPSQEPLGPESAYLSIEYAVGSTCYYSIIVTHYGNALAAYNQGLRGAALLEALGGILPDFRCRD